ncbi:MAG: cation-transporting P-type ATPase [Syntrophobacterales bacterium]|nr:cation-transporting P-type ATPase [Syntrophobacterales bacterium]
MIRVTHDRVKGRVRLRIKALKDNPILKAYLREKLTSLDGICDLRLGTATGSLLVFYKPPIETLDDVLRIVNDLLSQFSLKRKSTDLKPAIIDDVSKPQVNNVYSPTLSSEPPWHSLKPEECLAYFESSMGGLSEKEVSRRVSLWGSNDINTGTKVSGWQLFVKQFASLPVILLGAVSVVSIVTGGLGDALIISGVVVANALIGYITEKSSNEAIVSLQSIEEDEAIVIRNGKEIIVPRKDLVPGDIMVIKAGHNIPADGRLIKAENLYVDESPLSGESLPIEKKANVILPEATSIFERINMVYRGTLVVGGSGIAVVVATGFSTHLGKLQTLLQEISVPKAPIEHQLSKLGVQLVWLCLLVCTMCFLIGMARGYGFLTMVRLSLALGAAAIPEGLPSVATTTFALAIRRMSKRGVLIRDLTSVEALGAIQILCIDKTGTITENRMEVQEIYAGGSYYRVENNTILSNGEPISPHESSNLRKILEISCLCTEAQPTKVDNQLSFKGSPTEVALITLANANAIPCKEIRKVYPLKYMWLRSENRPYMITIHENGNKNNFLAVKGNPKAVLRICSYEHNNGKIKALSDERIEEIIKENELLSSRGLRVLGFAYGYSEEINDEPSDLIWCGLIGMADPIKSEAREMVRALRRAGIKVVMLTGDQELTATSVAKTIDVSGKEDIRVIDASNFNSAKSLEEISSDIHEVDVFSRVSPSLKLMIVQALQQSGKVVGMTGDGINDAPALKAADVGVCMGRNGTKISQKVANVVLENDDLITLIAAIEEGRTIQDNIKKSVHFFLSSNLSEILMLTSCIALGLPNMLNPMQLLWINLISDIFPAVALSLDPPSPDVLSRPPRNANEPLFGKKDFSEMLRESSVMASGSLMAGLATLIRSGDIGRASTVAFHTLSLSQLLHAIVCQQRKGKDSLSSNPILTVGILSSMLLQVLAGIIPVTRQLLRLSPVSLLDWLLVALTTGITFVINKNLSVATSPSKSLKLVVPLNRETACEKQTLPQAVKEDMIDSRFFILESSEKKGVYSLEPYLRQH